MKINGKVRLMANPMPKTGSRPIQNVVIMPLSTATTAVTRRSREKAKTSKTTMMFVAMLMYVSHGTCFATKR